jgi:hypothetical protein
MNDKKTVMPIERVSQKVIPIELIEKKIYMIRGQKVMLDSDLAKLYCVA